MRCRAVRCRAGPRRLEPRRIGRAASGRTTLRLAAQRLAALHLTVGPGSVVGQLVFDAAAAHGYSMVYWTGAAAFAVGAVFTAVCLPPGVIEPDPDAIPA